METPGHTRGHIAYHCAAAKALFPGAGAAVVLYCVFLLAAGTCFSTCSGNGSTSEKQPICLLCRLSPVQPSITTLPTNRINQATPSLPSAAGCCSRARPSRCGPLYQSWPGCRPTHGCVPFGSAFGRCRLLRRAFQLVRLVSSPTCPSFPIPLSTSTRSNPQVWCAHEYTQANAKFAVTVNPSNAELLARKARVDEARATVRDRHWLSRWTLGCSDPVRRCCCHHLTAAPRLPPTHRPQGEPTVPSLLSEELATNPFLRPHDPEIRALVKSKAGAADWEVFGAVRAAKNGMVGRLMLAVYPLYDRLAGPISRVWSP
jgi:hypothetical protein